MVNSGACCDGFVCAKHASLANTVLLCDCGCRLRGYGCTLLNRQCMSINSKVKKTFYLLTGGSMNKIDLVSSF